MEITDRELALLSRVSPGYTCIYQLDGGRPVLLRGPEEHEELLSLSPEQAALAKSDALALVYEPDRAPMYLIRVTPERIDLLNSEFKKRGVASRQQLSFGEE